MATPLRDLGIPQEFLQHAGRGEIMEEAGLTGTGIAAQTAAFAKYLLPNRGVNEPRAS